MHCISIAPFILKNAEALNKACLQVSILSGAFCRAVASCGSIYRRGFGINESFHQPLNHGSANTKRCYKVRQRYQFHIRAGWEVLPPELPVPISVELEVISNTSTYPAWWCLTYIWQIQQHFIAVGYKVTAISSGLITFKKKNLEDKITLKILKTIDFLNVWNEPWFFLIFKINTEPLGFLMSFSFISHQTSKMPYFLYRQKHMHTWDFWQTQW